MEKPYPGCREIIREAFIIQGIPEESINISLSSLSDSSYKIYNTALKKWFNYCLLHKVDLFTASISDVLSFLTAEFNNGLSYSSINSTRSALSLIIKEDIGEVRCYLGSANCFRLFQSKRIK